MKLDRLLGAAALLAILCLAPALTGCGGALPPELIDGDSPDQRLAVLEEDTEAVAQLISAFHFAFDAQDGSALAALFGPTAQVYLPDGRMVDGPGFITEVEQLWAGWSAVRTEYHLEGVKLSRPFGWAKWSETLSIASGSRQQTQTNLVTAAVERRGSTWLLGHLHVSSAARAGSD